MNKETLEEAAKRLYPDNMVDLGFNNIFNSSLIKRIDFIAGAKWQQNQEPNKYSEEDMREAYLTAIRSTGEGWNGEYANGNCPNIEKTFNDGFEIFIEQYKTK
jgi:hypothetical protein